MIIEGFGIELVRLKHQHIEFLRQKRNDPSISQFMEYRDNITPEMQEKWFQSIDNPFNNYFLIRTDGQFVGMIFGAEINWETRITGNGGMMIWDEQYQQSTTPLSAAFLLTELTFRLGFERVYVKVLRNNARAIRFNISLGYALLPNQTEVLNQRYELTPAAFEIAKSKYFESLAKLYSTTFKCIIDDINHSSEKNIVSILSVLSREQLGDLQLIIL